MLDLILIILAVLVVSLVSFIGLLFVGMKEGVIGRLLMVLVGFASGSMIGAAFFD